MATCSQYIDVNTSRYQHRATCIFLHGVGGSGLNLKQLIQQFFPSEDQTDHPLAFLYCIKFCFPDAPVAPVTMFHKEKMPSWYDIVGKASRLDEPAPGLWASVADVHGVLNCEIEILRSLGGGARNVMLAGFSQGSTMATIAGHTFTDALGAVAACAGYVCDVQRFREKFNPLLCSVPYVICHGDADSVVKPEISRDTIDLMKTLRVGSPVDVYWLKGVDHELVPEELAYVFTTYAKPILL